MRIIDWSSDVCSSDLGGGRLRDITVEQATINITALDTDHEKIVIAIDMRGPLRTALEVLDQQPLQYARGLGLDVTGIGGDAEMHVGLHFPLARNLDMKQVSVATEAELHDVRSEEHTSELQSLMRH